MDELVADDLKEWKCLYNFHTSPFHPYLKAFIGSIWVHRNWKTQQAVVSQSTIAEECGFGNGKTRMSGISTVRKYAKLAVDLGLCIVTPGKSLLDCTTYTFDLSAEIWQQRWSRDELQARAKGSTPVPSRGSSKFQTPAPSRRRDPVPSRGSSPHRVADKLSSSSEHLSSCHLDKCSEETVVPPPSAATSSQARPASQAEEASLRSSQQRVFPGESKPTRVPDMLVGWGFDDDLIPSLWRTDLGEQAGITAGSIVPHSRQLTLWNICNDFVIRQQELRREEGERQKASKELRHRQACLSWLLGCDEFKSRRLQGLQNGVNRWIQEGGNGEPPMTDADWSYLKQMVKEY
jgi:hypothetical protein